ncbi:MAG TPA: bifunctional phosphoglucose/phosphomannose isomerase [Ignavibacteriaceae bacterium]|nr:bifunctional phosphoglucose/phosphomannose isomerase [Ignavibacteriaceae bacterium]
MKLKDYVSKYDPQNQFNVLIDTWKQVEFAWNNNIDTGTFKTKKFRNIIVCGLGGSAISADILHNFLKDELKIPLFVNRNYNLPAFADKNTLLIISSYSGNTEETISCLKEGLDKQYNIICVSTGGKVEEIAMEHNILLVKMKPGFQPRYALGSSFFSLIKILSELKIIPGQDETVQKIKNIWQVKGQEYSKENNIAFECAEQLIGFIPVIYSTVDTSSAGYRFKCQFNENAKMHAFQNIIPELNHNEIIGWESFTEKQFSAKVINILDESYHPQIKKRFEITSELATKKGVDYLNIESDEDEFKVRLMDLIYLFDWITYYAAVLRGYDPSEIDYIHTLKERLS